MEVVFKNKSDEVDAIRFNDVEIKHFVACSSNTFLTVMCDSCIIRSGKEPWTREPTFLMDECACCHAQGYFKAVEIDSDKLLQAIRIRNSELGK